MMCTKVICFFKVWLVLVVWGFFTKVRGRIIIEWGDDFLIFARWVVIFGVCFRGLYWVFGMMF